VTIICFFRTSTESDIANALKELEKKFVESNMSHVKRLLQITIHVRRQWIEKESNRISEIIKKYPSLQHYEIVRHSIILKNYFDNTLNNKL